MRNALIPVLTIVGLQFSFLLAGAIIIENVFFLPGLGRLVFQGITQRDLIVVKIVVMLLVFAVILVNFLVDLGYAVDRPAAAGGADERRRRCADMPRGSLRARRCARRASSSAAAITARLRRCWRCVSLRLDALRLRRAGHPRQAAAALAPRTGSAPTSSAATCSRMIMVGARNSIAVALIAVGIGVGVGVPLGLLAAAKRGTLARRGDHAASTIWSSPFPALLIAILITAVFGPGAINAIIAIGIFNIPVFARADPRRGAVSCGRATSSSPPASPARARRCISVEHILPNILNTLVVQATIQFSLGILAEAALSYVGLGAQPPTPSWGQMLADSQTLIALAPQLAHPAGPCHRLHRARPQPAWATGCATSSIRACGGAGDEPARRRDLTLAIGATPILNGVVLDVERRRGARHHRRIRLGQVDDGAVDHAAAAAPARVAGGRITLDGARTAGARPSARCAAIRGRDDRHGVPGADDARSTR